MVNATAIDRQYLATMCGDDPEFEKELIDAYLESSPGLFAALEKGVAAGDADTVRGAAHTLKGSSRAIGAEDVARVSEVLEEKSREGDLTDSEALVTELQQVYGELEEFAKANWPA